MNKSMQKKSAGWKAVLFGAWLIINIRVAAGMGTSLERTLDGIVGGCVILVAIFLAIRFFKLPDPPDERKG